MLTGFILQDFENNSHHNLISELSKTDKFELFDDMSLKNLISFKWKSYGRRFFLVVMFFHVANMITFALFILHCYNPAISEAELEDFSTEQMEAHKEHVKNIEFRFYIILGILNIIPFVYENVQLCKQGVIDYFSSVWNYYDAIYVIMGFAILYLHAVQGSDSEIVKGIMAIQVLLHNTKMMALLRIFDSTSYLVTMIRRVFSDI